MIKDSYMITGSYILGNILPPIGKTLEEFFEEK